MINVHYNMLTLITQPAHTDHTLLFDSFMGKCFTGKTLSTDTVCVIGEILLIPLLLQKSKHNTIELINTLTNGKNGQQMLLLGAVVSISDNY